MLVTRSIELDRMLLHSLATSTVKSGMVSRTPLWVTGTPTAAKSPCAAQVEPCCKRCTISFVATRGSGTNPNKKHKGKRTARAAREPKQRTKAPIHERTSANICSESLPSADIEVDKPIARPAIKKDAASKAEPARTFPAANGLRDCLSRKISATVSGRIRSKWVYSSSASANRNVLTSGCQPISKEAEHKTRNRTCDD